MQTPLHLLPYPLSSFNLASVLDHSGLLNPKENQSSALSPTAMADSKWVDVQPNLPSCDEAMSQLLFQPTFFGAGMNPSICAKSVRNNEGFGGHWGSRGENIFLKRAGGTSFSIDSLLGISDVIQHNHGRATPAIREHHHHVHYSCVYGPAPFSGKQSFNGVGVPHGVPRSREPEQQGQFCNVKRRKGTINGMGACHNSVVRAVDSAPKLKQQPHGKASATPGPKSSFNSNKMACLPNKTSVGLSEKVQDSGQNPVRRATKTKRVRTIFTPEQLERLEAEFERQQYMVGPERLFLASSLHLTEAQVKVWFQNRRIKWRKQHLELQQQRLAVIRSQRIGIGDSDESSGSEFGSSAAASSTSTVLSLCNNENNNIMNNNYALHHHHVSQDARHLANPI